MKSSDRAILIGLVVAGVAAAFWFLLLAPKRDEASELSTQVDDLRAEVDTQQQLVATAGQAQDEYEANYSSLVTLGKAAPADGDLPSLLEQLQALSDRSGVQFSLLQLGSGAELPAAPTPPPAAPAEGEDAAVPPGETATASSTTPAAPTEASAASLPIGATVGPAGLGVLPYELKFSGDFFEIADLMKRIDQLIGAKSTKVDVGGRLLTVNEFTMEPVDGTAQLDVSMVVTSYVLPQSQGLTAGATSEAPPGSIPAATSTTTSTTP